MKKYFLTAFLFLLILPGCTEESDIYNKPLPENTKAADLIPTIDGYNEFDANNAVEKINTVALAVGIAVSQPELEVAAKVSDFALCLEGRGVAAKSAYYDLHINEKTEGVVNFATVGVVDINEATDINNYISCLKEKKRPYSIIAEEDICGDQFIIKSDYNEFLVVINGIHESKGDNSCEIVKEAILTQAESLAE